MLPRVLTQSLSLLIKVLVRGILYIKVFSYAYTPICIHIPIQQQNKVKENYHSYILSGHGLEDSKLEPWRVIWLNFLCAQNAKEDQ